MRPDEGTIPQHVARPLVATLIDYLVIRAVRELPGCPRRPDEQADEQDEDEVLRGRARDVSPADEQLFEIGLDARGDTLVG